MPYKFRNGKIQSRGIEYSMSYHCNLRCSGCSHLSPYLSKRFPLPEVFHADISRLKTAFHAEEIRLVGGEPLLNPEISSFINIAKKSGIADAVVVFTNGLLLNKMDYGFWENADIVSVSVYPESSPKGKDIERFKKCAAESKTELRILHTPFFRTTAVTKPHRSDWVTDLIFKTCKEVHLHHCHMIYDGRLYKCSISAFLAEYLKRMGDAGYDPSQDSFDFHGAGDLFNELKDFLLSPKTLDACRHCLGYVGKLQEHHQLDPGFCLDPGLQNIRRSSHIDRRVFVAETVRYYRRRIIERLKTLTN